MRIPMVFVCSLFEAQFPYSTTWDGVGAPAHYVGCRAGSNTSGKAAASLTFRVKAKKPSPFEYEGLEEAGIMCTGDAV